MNRGGPVVDVHVHLYPERRLGGLMRWTHRAIPAHPVPPDVTVERIVADLRDAGVERFLSAVFPLKPGEARGLNRFNAELSRSVPEMIPLGTVHQDDDDPVAIVREAFDDLGLRGLKLHPPMMGMAVDDPRMEPVFAAAQEAGLPVLIHTQFPDGYGSDAEKAPWERLFRSFPRTEFLLAHSFFPDLAYAFSLLPRFANVHLDATNVFGLIGWSGGPLPFGLAPAAWGPGELAAAIEGNPGRVLFGSDHPAGMGTMRQIVRRVADFGLEEKTARAVLYGNAHALLGRLGI